MEKKDQDFWFPAKKYGYGWGFPITWQGRLVFLAYFVLLGLATLWLVSGSPMRIAAYLVFVLICSGALVFVCHKKGEPPQYRRGNKK